jgi:hypothetical protein
VTGPVYVVTTESSCVSSRSAPRWTWIWLAWQLPKNRTRDPDQTRIKTDPPEVRRQQRRKLLRVRIKPKEGMPGKLNDASKRKACCSSEVYFVILNFLKVKHHNFYENVCVISQTKYFYNSYYLLYIFNIQLHSSIGHYIRICLINAKSN